MYTTHHAPHTTPYSKHTRQAASLPIRFPFASHSLPIRFPFASHSLPIRSLFAPPSRRSSDHWIGDCSDDPGERRADIAEFVHEKVRAHGAGDAKVADGEYEGEEGIEEGGEEDEEAPRGPGVASKAVPSEEVELEGKVAGVDEEAAQLLERRGERRMERRE